MNMAFKVIDTLMIVVFGTRDPTDADWQTYLRLIQSHGIVRMRHLVCTDGGTPSFKQRGAYAALLADRVVPTAIVCDAILVRAGLAALSWLDSSTKPFPPSGLADALRFLEVPMSRFDLVSRELQKLRRELAENVDR